MDNNNNKNIMSVFYFGLQCNINPENVNPKPYTLNLGKRFELCVCCRMLRV